MADKTTKRVPTQSEEQLLRWFDYGHLPRHLQVVSQPICDLAWETVWKSAAPSAELTTGLRKLLEAKDALVRHGILEREMEMGRTRVDL
jgi:hypothetical protein